MRPYIHRRILSVLLLPAIVGWSAAVHALVPHPAEKTVHKQEQLTIDGVTLDYTTTAGKLLLRDKQGTPHAEIFYVAYTKDQSDDERRPVTFLWDGGPGGASIATNVLGLGPKRYSISNHTYPGPPYQTETNPYTLLQHSDLVYLDPVGTGYSRAIGEAKNSDFWGVESDADAITEAIKRYVRLNNRWQSPKFVLGASYGTTRASVVSHRLQSHGIAVNGVVLLASALNFGMFSTGMSDQFVMLLPTQAAIAWHHGKTAHQSTPLPEFLKEVEAFARDVYLPAMFKGNTLAPDEHNLIATQLSEYIGLSADYIKKANLRVSAIRFRKELLREEGIVLGRMDGRTTMTDFDRAGEEPENDYWFVENFALPLVAIVGDLLDGQLGYDTEQTYQLEAEGAIQAWDWSHDLPPFAGISQREYDERNIFPQNTWASADLSVAMRTNAALKVFQANGYYDMATPYYWAYHDLAQMSFDPALTDRITIVDYEAGHVIFTDDDILAQMHDDLSQFYKSALD